MRVKVGLAVVALFVALMAAPASGGTPPVLTVSPMSGPVGTEFVVSGDQCYPVPAAPDLVGGIWKVSAEGSAEDDFLAFGGAPSSEAGIWEDGFSSDPLTGPLPGPGTYVVEAGCDNGVVIEFTYEPVTITVTEVPVTAPPLVESTTTTTTTAAPAPAVAAAASPAFTG